MARAHTTRANTKQMVRTLSRQLVLAADQKQQPCVGQASHADTSAKASGQASCHVRAPLRLLRRRRVPVLAAAEVVHGEVELGGGEEEVHGLPR